MLKAHFKISDATLRAKHIKAAPSIYLAHTKTLEQINARYDIPKVILKPFTFGHGSKSFSIDNAVLGDLPNECYTEWLKIVTSQALSTTIHLISNILI